MCICTKDARLGNIYLQAYNQVFPIGYIKNYWLKGICKILVPQLAHSGGESGQPMNGQAAPVAMGPCLRTEPAYFAAN